MNILIVIRQLFTLISGNTEAQHFRLLAKAKLLLGLDFFIVCSPLKCR